MSRHTPASVPIRPDEDRPEPPRLMFFCDPHGEFKSIFEAVQRERPQAIVLLGDGDLQAERPLQVELAAIRASAGIWSIHGNHDNDAERFSDYRSGNELADCNLHGRVVRIADCLVAGLSGIFREWVWDPSVRAAEASFSSVRLLRRATPAYERWRGGVSLRHRSTIFSEELIRVASQRADLIVTHEDPGAPHSASRGSTRSPRPCA